MTHLNVEPSRNFIIDLISTVTADLQNLGSVFQILAP